MDPINLHAMFDLYEDDDYVAEEENRKNKREYRYWRTINIKMQKQCEIMIQQIKKIEEQNRIQSEKRAAQMAEVARLKDSSSISQKAYHELVVETLRFASMEHEKVANRGLKLSNDETHQMKQLTTILEQQEKYLKKLGKLEATFGIRSGPIENHEQLAEKEKKVLAMEALVKVKRAELEELKKEQAQLEKQNKDRCEYLTKQIAYYDGLIKEKQERHALKAKLLHDIELVQSQIQIEKEKRPHLKRLKATKNESQDLDGELPPIVFKNPNDFPLEDLLRSPSVKSGKNKKQKSQNSKQKIKGNPKRHQGSKRHRLSRQKSSTSIQGSPSTSSQGFAVPQVPQIVENPKISQDIEQNTPPTPKKQKQPSAKKNSKTPSKRVTFTDEVMAETGDPKSDEIPGKSVNVAQVIMKTQVKKSASSPAIADNTPKGPTKKISPRTLIPAQNTVENASKTPETPSGTQTASKDPQSAPKTLEVPSKGVETPSKGHKSALKTPKEIQTPKAPEVASKTPEVTSKPVEEQKKQIEAQKSPQALTRQSSVHSTTSNQNLFNYENASNADDDFASIFGDGNTSNNEDIFGSNTGDNSFSNNEVNMDVFDNDFTFDGGNGAGVGFFP